VISDSITWLIFSLLIALSLLWFSFSAVFVGIDPNCCCNLCQSAVRLDLADTFG
jgi:hypothetical protein